MDPDQRKHDPLRGEHERCSTTISKGRVFAGLGLLLLTAGILVQRERSTEGPREPQPTPEEPDIDTDLRRASFAQLSPLLLEQIPVESTRRIQQAESRQQYLGNWRLHREDHDLWLREQLAEFGQKDEPESVYLDYHPSICVSWGDNLFDPEQPIDLFQEHRNVLLKERAPHHQVDLLQIVNARHPTPALFFLTVCQNSWEVVQGWAPEVVAESLELCEDLREQGLGAKEEQALLAYVVQLGALSTARLTEQDNSDYAFPRVIRLGNSSEVQVNDFAEFVWDTFAHEEVQVRLPSWLSSFDSLQQGFALQLLVSALETSALTEEKILELLEENELSGELPRNLHTASKYYRLLRGVYDSSRNDQVETMLRKALLDPRSESREELFRVVLEYELLSTTEVLNFLFSSDQNAISLLEVLDEYEALDPIHDLRRFHHVALSNLLYHRNIDVSFAAFRSFSELGMLEDMEQGDLLSVVESIFFGCRQSNQQLNLLEALSNSGNKGNPFLQQVAEGVIPVISSEVRKHAESLV